MPIAIRNANDISNMVKVRRNELGITQAQLATQAGVSRRWLANLEAGNAGTHIDKILATLSVLGITLTAHSDPDNDQVTDARSALLGHLDRLTVTKLDG